MSELTKEELCGILEVCLLYFENQQLYKLPGMQITYSQIKMGKETLDFIRSKW